MRKITIAIDGPAGSGKSTVAKKVAVQLGYTYLDTGAMYRAITLKALRTKTSLEDEIALKKLTEQSTIELKMSGDELKIYLDGQDVSRAIRRPEVTENAFYIARTREVRKLLVAQQQQMGKGGGVVAEGRDMTTVVFPQAEVKIYLTASLEERAKRRYLELLQQGVKAELKKVKEEIAERDEKDMTRKDGPLKKIPSAYEIDTTHLAIDQVVERILLLVQKTTIQKEVIPSPNTRRCACQ
jgi:cytidylate kinase